MPPKRTTTLATLTTVTAISAIIIVATALQNEEPAEQQPTHPSALLPSHNLRANPSDNLDELLEEDIDSKLLPLALENDGLSKEGIISFSDEASYLKFLASVSAKGLTLITSSDRLLSARVGFQDFTQLEGIDGAEITPNYPVTLPEPPQISAQAGALAFKDSALRSIGITADNSNWGQGVTVAVIDSGVNAHIALKDGVTQIALTELSDGGEQLSHGTAVASIISGNHSSTPGVAPASEILSIRVTNAAGSSDSYTLAEAILAAVDSGAQIINISMGSANSSTVLANAVRYAQNQGAVIVASSGNEGASQLSYPAAYSGVISVGAIEANGEHLDFSNQGESLSLSAPGFEVNAAWGENQRIGFSGTSASAPFVSGSIAAILSQNPHFTTQQAADLLIRSVSEAGIPGTDSQYGAGTLDVGRALENGTAGIYDIAVTGQVLQTAANGSESLLVVIQNQGTEALYNSPVSVNTPLGTTSISINNLSPGAVYTHSVPLSFSSLNENFSVNTTVGTSTVEDIDPQNNTRQNQFSKTTP